MSDRLALALPIDVARQLDHTVTQTQLTNNTFQGTADDRDVLASLIEDAEDEYRAVADVDMRLSRVGTPNQRETFEQVTYEVSGHRAFKRNFSRVGGNYLPQEVTKSLDNGNVLPFDSTEDDAAYIYRGIGGSTTGDEWEDVTADKGDTWDIINHRSGIVVIHPVELARAQLAGHRGVGLAGGRLREFRLAISYRHGTPGGSRASAGATTLDTSLTDTATGSTAVADASFLPDAGIQGGSIILKIGTEYVRATVDPGADTIDIEARGVRGTSASSHSSGDRVQYTPPSVRKAVSSRAGMGLIQSGRYSAFMPDSEDAIEKTDMMDRLEATWNALTGGAE